jgi:DNA-binding response OmpR family regulator
MNDNGAMSKGPLRILLIEDSASDAKLMQTRLASVTDFAFSVDHATRLSQGISAMSLQKFDAILLDLNLPDSTGLDTLRATREAAGTIPIIVLTAMDDRTLVTESMENGADSYLVKDKTDGNRIAVGILWAIRNREPA